MAHHTGDAFEQPSEAPWWPALTAVAVIPTLILIGIVLASLGASDAVVVGVIVGPLVVAGLGAFAFALAALVYVPYANWREARRREKASGTPQTRPSIRPEPRPSDSVKERHGGARPEAAVASRRQPPLPSPPPPLPPACYESLTYPGSSRARTQPRGPFVAFPQAVQRSIGLSALSLNSHR